MICSNRTLCVAAALSLAASACQQLRPAGLAGADYPGVLLEPTALPTQAVWQQQVTARWRRADGEHTERAFAAAVQRRGEALTVVGLSPVGAVGFSVTQTPAGIEVVNNIPDQMVVPPRFILLDVQRALYPWFDGSLSAGKRTTTRQGEQITERWTDGALAERTFARLDGEPAGLIRVTYEWAEPGWAAPTRAVLDNGWFGYRLTIATNRETRLASEERP